MWIIAAISSAIFAGITSILAKCGIKKTDSDVATALRTAVVLVFSWIMVFVAGSAGTITSIDKKSLLFIILSGLAAGTSWLFYFKALSMGNVNNVVPVDKLSTVITILLAIIVFGETNHLAVKLICTVLIGTGVVLMVEKKSTGVTKNKRGWLVYAILSAIFAAATSILAKIGITNVESNLGTAIRTGVILALSLGIVLAKGKAKQMFKVDLKELVFIVLSGIATGISWLCYYYAMQNGVVSVVVPIDKLSIVVTVIFSFFVFKEKLSKKALIGLLLLVSGTVLMAFTG